MQKKIGIITFHNCTNYGASLQTYALYKVLKNDGFDVEVIDYVNDKIDGELKERGKIRQKNIKGFVKAAIKKYHGNRKDKSFAYFNESKLTLSCERNIRRNDIKSIASKYDIIITGSDQVWNMNLTDNDLTYCLDFVFDGTSCISYAASAGDKLDFDFSNPFSIISKFKAVSVREKSFSDYLKDHYKMDSMVCCDPTLLADRTIFEEIKSKRIIKKKYIFCFLMSNKPGIMEVARTIAKERDLLVIDNKTSFEFFIHSSPEDYLSWIYNAEYVLTDSFHGTVFSIIFGKQFISDKFDGDGNVKSRIQDLLSGLSIEERFQSIDINSVNYLKNLLNSTIDTDEVERERKELAKKSYEWLIDSITK